MILILRTILIFTLLMYLEKLLRVSNPRLDNTFNSIPK